MALLVGAACNVFCLSTLGGTKQSVSSSTVIQDEQQGEQQAAGGDDQPDMPATQQHTLAPLQDLGLNSGSTSGQHAPSPASRYASAQPVSHHHQALLHVKRPAGSCLIAFCGLVFSAVLGISSNNNINSYMFQHKLLTDFAFQADLF